MMRDDGFDLEAAIANMENEGGPSLPDKEGPPSPETRNPEPSLSISYSSRMVPLGVGEGGFDSM